MKKRVVITGLGVISPNGLNINDFLKSLKNGISGIKYIPELENYNFNCCVGGVPEIKSTKYDKLLAKYEISEADISILYAVITALEAYELAGFHFENFNENEVLIDFGSIIGSCFGGIEIFLRKMYPLISSGNLKKLGSQIIEHWMPSGSVASISKILGFANQNTVNSSACSTGLEAVIMAYERIKFGKAKVMLAGGTDPYSPFAWAGFDSMRLLARKYNNTPEKASRPMSGSANGFVPSAGAGILILEELEHALNRNAKIYAEIVGAEINSGGQRNGGTMTYPNPQRVVDCIRKAVQEAKIKFSEIDLISGHLTSTKADVLEIKNWKEALELTDYYPYINAPKSMFGHMIGAAGAVETIAAVLQLYNNFVHANLNCEDLHPEIEKLWDKNKIPQQTITNINLNYVAKASFGFGDVNSCIILKKFNPRFI
jgi:3-oxoacyl-(acyl-carrier-protein) synthase